MPFLFTAGKGMDERVCELRVRYKPNKLNRIMAATSAKPGGEETRNELVMRVQPDEASVSRFEAGSSSSLPLAGCSLLARGWAMVHGHPAFDSLSRCLPLAACLSLLAGALHADHCQGAWHRIRASAQAGGDGHDLRAPIRRWRSIGAQTLVFRLSALLSSPCDSLRLSSPLHWKTRGCFLVVWGHPCCLASLLPELASLLRWQTPTSATRTSACCSPPAEATIRSLSPLLSSQNRGGESFQCQ